MTRAGAFFLLLPWIFPVQAAAGVFPYPAHKKTLANGLDVVVIETPEFKDVLSFNTLVLAGSGREEEKGRTGLAHLFEHILFRHRYGGADGGYDEWMGRLGTHNNAWTWFDVTYYHPTTFAANLDRRPKGGLPGLVELESSRFASLDFTEKLFKTETGAVLGEYRRLASFPAFRLEERLSALMFPHHPYGHSTMGEYADVLDMPNQFQAARKFYETHYRPNNCVLVVAGDVRAAEVFKAVEPWYADWKAQAVAPVRPKGEAPGREQREHVAWDADVSPLAWVAYRMPAFKPGAPESAAAELLSELLVSPAAPLYKKLRYEKQSASALGFEEGTRGFESVDPRAVVVSAELYKEKYAAGGRAYAEEVISDVIAGLEELKTFPSRPGVEGLLKAVKSKFRYDFLAELSSPGAIARAFSWHYRFSRDEKVLDRLLESVEAVGPEDIAALAKAQFTPENRVVLTLAYEPKTAPEAGKKP